MGLHIKKYFSRFPIIIAHRGASKSETENSAQAIRAAIECGSDMIEVDLRNTKDGIFVLHHDRNTHRLTGQRRIVEESTGEELKSFPLKGGGTILSLDEALEIVSGKIALNLELKSEGSGRQLAGYLQKIPYRGLLFVSSFLAAELEEFKRYFPQIPTGALVRNPLQDDIEDTARKGHISMNINGRYLKKWMIHGATERGIALFVYTVDDRNTFKRAVQGGVSGIFTNIPEKMVRWRDEL